MKTLTAKTTIIVLSCAVSISATFAEQTKSNGKPIAQAASPEDEVVSELQGTSWMLKSWSDKNLDAKKFAISAAFTIVSGKSIVSGHGAPNSYSAFYESKADGSFSIGNIFSTEMLSYDEEILYFNLLAQTRKYATRGNHLILSSKEGKELLVFEKNRTSDSPPTAFVMGRDSVRHKLPEAEATALARLISTPPEIAPAHPTLHVIYRVLIDDTEYALDTDRLILMQKDRTKIWSSPEIEKRILKAAGIKKP